MKTKVLTGIALAVAMTASSVYAANYLPEEPYSNFAIDQNVDSSGAGMMTDKAMPKQHQEEFWGWSVDEPLK